MRHRFPPFASCCTVFKAHTRPLLAAATTQVTQLGSDTAVDFPMLLSIAKIRPLLSIVVQSNPLNGSALGPAKC